MLESLEVLQVYRSDMGEVAARAMRFAAGIAWRLGATLVRHGSHPVLDGAFYDLNETIITGAEVEGWGRSQPLAGGHRASLVFAPASAGLPASAPSSASEVVVACDPWESEATLFAASGLAELLGDPAKAPLVPGGHYAAHTVGFAVFAALAAVHARLARGGGHETAHVDALAVLAWMNWKAAASGAMGRDISREGDHAEWPVLPCRDGHVAFIFVERDWDAVIDMLGEPDLRDARFATFAGRAKHRDDYMSIIRKWALAHDKATIDQLFLWHAVPGASVSTPQDLLSDALLSHRKALEVHQPLHGPAIRLPRLPHRIARAEEGHAAPATKPISASDLPLAGVRVLDLGIITAGAGVSAMLADLGAEVIKVESATYPDPFRAWAGASDGESPLFKFNNRNKVGIAIDLKTKAGLAQFIDLARSADIVVENFRRGVLDRLGLTFDALHAANPRLLLASISGQGLDGPGVNHTTFGSTLEASSGFAAMTFHDDGMPCISGRNLNYPDQIVCLYATGIITAAVVDCMRSGIGRHIDIAQRDCAIYQAGDMIAHVAQAPGDSVAGIRAAVQFPFLDAVFKTGDQRAVALTALAAEDLGRVAGLRDGRHATLAEWALGRTAQAAAEAFRQAGCGASVVRLGSELLHDARLAAAQIYLTSPKGAMVKGFPYLTMNVPMRIRCDAPGIGEHDARYL